MLTDTALRNLKPKSKPYKASDRDGMYVTVSTTGTVTFRYDYRLNGRRETLTIGRYGPSGISLAMAREKLIDAKKAVAQGKSPAHEKQREKRRLTAAKTFGDVAGKWLADARMPEPLYVIERFDRRAAKSGWADTDGSVQRLHQIDLCQALGVSPSRKYESEGGLGLHHLFEVLQGTFVDRPAVAINAVVQWVAFNYLVGNLDAHAKNIAFLMRGQKADVAPFYDMLCVEAYLPRATMSMAIAGENKPGWVEGLHWDAMAFEARVAPRLVRSVLKKLVERIPDGISQVIGDARLMPSEREFVRESILPVIEERCSFVQEAIKGRQSSLQDVLASRELDPAVIDRLAR